MVLKLHSSQNYLLLKLDTQEQIWVIKLELLGGAFAPTIATMLWTDFDIFWVSVYIAFASMLTVLSVMALSETDQSDLKSRYLLRSPFDIASHRRILF